MWPTAFLERHGASVTILPVDGTGRIDPAAVRRADALGANLLTIAAHKLYALKGRGRALRPARIDLDLLIPRRGP